MFMISLTNSELSVEVSEEDHLKLILLGPWHLAGKGYPRTNRPPYQYMHRVIGNRIGLSPDLEIDHKDRNKLNAKRDNLRSATRVEQCHNTGKQSNNTSGHKGISLDIRRLRWIIQVTRDGKTKYVGSCKTLEAAIIKRNDYLKRNNLTYVE